MRPFIVLFYLITIALSIAAVRSREQSVGQAPTSIRAKCPMNFGITVADAEKAAQWSKERLDWLGGRR